LKEHGKIVKVKRRVVINIHCTITDYDHHHCHDYHWDSITPIFIPEDGCDMFLQNVNHLQDYAVSLHRIPQSADKDNLYMKQSMLELWVENM
jgi:hypothetical protein